MTDIGAGRFKYRAFISYRHKDKAWGDWLHRALESYRVPRELVGQPGKDGPIPARLVPVFRDREDLAASTDLGTEIRTALNASANLVVICSPGAVASKFVADEIIEFKRLGRADRIFAIIAEGEPNATDPALECFPEALKFHVGPDGTLTSERTEPIAADAREQGDGKENAKLKLIAGILGVGFDQLRRRELEAQRRRFRRFAAVAATLIVIFAGLAGAAAWFGYRADVERVRAEDNLDKARRTANGVVADLAEQFRDTAGMQAALGRRILDRAKVLMDELGNQGEMTDERLRDRGRALGLLGRVTLDLGENAPAAGVLKESLRIWTSLLTLKPDDPVALIQAARSENYLSWAMEAQGDAAEVTRLQQSARARVARVLALPGLSADPALEADALDLSLYLADDINAPDYLARQQRAIALREALAASDTTGEQQRLLASAYRVASAAASKRGDQKLAVEIDAKAVVAIEALAARDTYVARWQFDLATHYMASGGEIFRLGDIAEAKRRFNQSLDVAGRLIAVDPTNARYREVAAQSLGLLNAFARLEKDVAGQEQNHQQVVALWRSLVQIDPRNLVARDKLASALAALANFYGMEKRHEEAVAAARETLTVREELADAANDFPSQKARLAAMVSLAYEIQAGDNTSEEALRLLAEAETMLRLLLTQHPDDEDLIAARDQIAALRQMIEAWRNAATP